ncbi:MAG: S49 family peptidase [Pseudomonadota bacterium]
MPNWNQVLEEIKREDARLFNSAKAGLDSVRRKYLKRLFRLTGRNVIAYYSGWLSKPYAFGMDLRDEDKNAFMMAIHKMDRSQGLDLILHTPGGDIAAAESLVEYLRSMFGNDVRAIVPQIAMSAGTMVACSCKSIVMAKHSNLGPIDPQISGVPAAAVKEEFEQAIREITKDQSRLAAWQFILQKYTPTYLATCENAVRWSKDFVTDALKNNMFSQSIDKDTLASRIVDRFSDFSENKSHGRHIGRQECIEYGLNIEILEDDPDLQDSLLTVHHCFIHSLSNSPSIKIVENQNGVAFIKTVG